MKEQLAELKNTLDKEVMILGKMQNTNHRIKNGIGYQGSNPIKRLSEALKVIIEKLGLSIKFRAGLIVAIIIAIAVDIWVIINASETTPLALGWVSFCICVVALIANAIVLHWLYQNQKTAIGGE